MNGRLALTMSSGVAIVAPASLSCITTYVVLEQEDWFEREAAFICRWLQPGMCALDIGANLGVYSLPMARAVGESGQVFAYEPSSQTRSHLEESKALNSLSRLMILSFALSNTAGQGKLHLGRQSGESSGLTQGPQHSGETEAITLATLDAEYARLGEPAFDFIKIDAEREEGRIVEGGQAVLTRLSPLVMFEVRAGGVLDLDLCRAFKALGYGLYRLLGDGSMLVGWDEGSLDPFELNLFAAKPDRAASLAAGGFLALPVSPVILGSHDPAWIDDLIHNEAFYFSAGRIGDPKAGALAALGVWRDVGRGADARFGALQAAFLDLKATTTTTSGSAAISTLARTAWEFGDRAMAINCLGHLSTAAAPLRDSPFLSPSPRFDTVSPQGRSEDWFAIAVLEQAELLREHSSAFGLGDLVALADWSQNDLASPEMVRRLVLQLPRKKKDLPADLESRMARGSHLNAAQFTRERLTALSAV